MAQFKQKSKYNFWYSPPVLSILFCISILFAYNIFGIIQKERETNKNKISELNKIDELRKRQMALTKDIDSLNTEEGVEETVRDKFQVVKPGEKMVVIVDPNTKKNTTEEITTDHSFWGFIKRMFRK